MARVARGMQNVEAKMQMMTGCMKDGDDDGVHARREVTQGVAGTFGVLEASCYSLNAVEGVYVL